MLKNIDSQYGIAMCKELPKYTYQYFVNEAKKTVTCKMRSLGKEVIAKAVCSADDIFDVKLGKKLARLRAQRDMLLLERLELRKRINARLHEAAELDYKIKKAKKLVSDAKHLR